MLDYIQDCIGGVQDGAGVGAGAGAGVGCGADHNYYRHLRHMMPKKEQLLIYKLLINLFIYFHYRGKYTTVFVERIIIKIKQVIIGPK